MNAIPKEKRNKVVVVMLITGMVLSGLYFGLINFQQKSLSALQGRKQAAERKRDQVDWAIKHASEIEADLAETGKKLGQLENGMAASEDLNSWFYNTIRQFKSPYKVEIPQFSPIDGPKDVSLLPSFPYKQATITLGGTAFFYDFGRFVADFENQFPYLRLLNLTLEPSPSATGTDRERLTFKMDVTVLVKPNAT
jgi:hypothetical protein